VTVTFLTMVIQESLLISCASGCAKNESEICLMLSRDCEAKLKVVLMEDSSSFSEVQLSEVRSSDTVFKMWCHCTYKYTAHWIATAVAIILRETLSFCVCAVCSIKCR
jgi:hypothetical protein